MPAWDAEIVVDASLARWLVDSQVAQLAGRPLRFLAAGWDNAVYVVDERWSFRFPQRSVAVPGIRREIAVLPELAPMLPSPVSVPVHVGRPTERYPWPFFGAPFLDGLELAAASLDEPGRSRLAIDLGAFLRLLHQPALVPAFGARLPVDPMRRTDMPYRAGVARDWLDQAGELGIWDRSLDGAAGELLDAATRLPGSATLRVTHGDLHLRHALVHGDGHLAGVIDWGDTCLADPAIDLSLAWSYLGPEARRAFLDAYGPVDAAAALRARVLGLMLNAALAVHARSQGDERLEREAAAGLRRVLAD